MNKFNALITYVIPILFINVAAAQDDLKNAEAKDTKRDTKTFNVVSLDGKNKNVKVIPDYVKRVLKIVCLKDTISLADFWGVPPEIQVLNKSFIEIKYEVRGGSNLGLGNTLILCVNSDRLFEAMHILRYSNWESGDLKKDYHIKLILNGNSKNNYGLNVHIYDDVNSKANPEANYTYNNQTALSFDTKRNVFYSIKENVYNQLVTTKTGKKTKQKIVGNLPVIILGKEIYYFIGNKWYQSGNSNEMYEL